MTYKKHIWHTGEKITADKLNIIEQWVSLNSVQKSAYAIAVEGGYEGTEEEFEQMLATSANNLAAAQVAAEQAIAAAAKITSSDSGDLNYILGYDSEEDSEDDL